MTAPWKRRVVVGDCTLYEGDCLDVVPALGRFDAVVADPPYGSTACQWDAVIPIPPMWGFLRSAVVDGGAIALTASQPFSSMLVASNTKNFAHEWVWNKRFAANFVQAARQPLKDHELVLVFSTNGKQPTYYPQMLDRADPIMSGGNKPSAAIPIRGPAARSRLGKVYRQKHPTTATSMAFSIREKPQGFHPTQKPVGLMKYIVRTYTAEHDAVLDFAMGSGSTGVACVEEGRAFAGVERDPHYFDIACARIREAVLRKAGGYTCG